MKTLKPILYILFLLATVKACQYDHACSVVESIPDNCFERIAEDHPEVCDGTMSLAEFWEEKGDSIKNDVRVTENTQNHWAMMADNQ